MHPQVKNWFAAEPDPTLAEVQQKLHSEAGISLIHQESKEITFSKARSYLTS
jgi:hypothetical protein